MPLPIPLTHFAVPFSKKPLTKVEAAEAGISDISSFFFKPMKKGRKKKKAMQNGGRPSKNNDSSVRATAVAGLIAVADANGADGCGRNECGPDRRLRRRHRGRGEERHLDDNEEHAVRGAARAQKIVPAPPACRLAPSLLRRSNAHSRRRCTHLNAHPCFRTNWSEDENLRRLTTAANHWLNKTGKCEPGIGLRIELKR